MYTARARGCWESCGVLMVTFPRCAWKESTKLQFDLVWNTHALCMWSGGSTRSLQRLQDSFAKRLGLTLPPPKNRFNYHTLVLFYKIRQNLAPKYLCSLVPDLSSTTSGYSFRKFSYPVPLTKKSATLESFGMTFPLTSNLPARSRPSLEFISHCNFSPSFRSPPPPPHLPPVVSSLPPSSTLFSQERSSDK